MGALKMNCRAPPRQIRFRFQLELYQARQAFSAFFKYGVRALDHWQLCLYDQFSCAERSSNERNGGLNLARRLYKLTCLAQFGRTCQGPQSVRVRRPSIALKYVRINTLTSSKRHSYFEELYRIEDVYARKYAKRTASCCKLALFFGSCILPCSLEVWLFWKDSVEVLI